MSSNSKGKRRAAADVTASEESPLERYAGTSARDERIRCRAYELYLERGEEPGRALEDWLQAERDLERKGL